MQDKENSRSNLEYYTINYKKFEKMLLTLLDSPVKFTFHIGSTSRETSFTSGVIDILVIVTSLHEITSLDEKRLNLAGFYRLHHPYKKKCVFSQFENMQNLKEVVRLHIVEQDSEKAKRYLQTDEQLKTDDLLEHNFSQFKSEHHLLVKRDYEEKKSQWFKSNIAKQ